MPIPDFNDIVFATLNKEYGAYSLRKRYNKVVILSIVLACLVGCAAILIPFLGIPEQKSKEIYTSRFVTMDNLMPPDELGGVPPPPAPVPQQSKTSARQITPQLEYIAPTIVDTILPVEKPIMSNTDSMLVGIDDKGINNGAGDEKGTGTNTLSGTGNGGGGEGGAGTGNGLYSKVDIMPSFKGGDINKFREWVQKKTKYPQVASVNGIQGKVYITFIVESDGSVSNVKVARGVDPLIDDEALKSVKSSPKWMPGRHKGKAVRVSYYITVNFEL
jgi:periplasmic protein TonB